jgi:sulfur-carrier protein
MKGAVKITIHVPRDLRAYCDGASELTVSALNVRAALDELELHYPAVHRGVRDESGRMRRHINLFVNTSHMCECDGLDTVLESGDQITILPAVSGG